MLGPEEWLGDGTGVHASVSPLAEGVTRSQKPIKGRRGWKLALLVCGFVAVAMLALATGASAQTVSNTASIGIQDPDNTGDDPSPSTLYPSPIAVSGVTGNISALTVTLSDIVNLQYTQDLG